MILSADGSGVLKWFVDGSYGIHPNLRGHTGGGVTMGRGYPINHSGKQKLNTRSSTESEVVGVDDLMPAILCTRLFMEAQGYGLRRISYTRTTMRLFFWRRTVKCQVDRGLNTSTFVFSLLLTESRRGCQCGVVSDGGHDRGFLDQAVAGISV